MPDPIEETVSGFAAGLLISSGRAIGSGRPAGSGRLAGGSTVKRCGGAPAPMKLGRPGAAPLLSFSGALPLKLDSMISPYFLERGVYPVRRP
jgi:hypothetical protein